MEEKEEGDCRVRTSANISHILLFLSVSFSRSGKEAHEGKWQLGGRHWRKREERMRGWRGEGRGAEEVLGIFFPFFRRTDVGLPNICCKVEKHVFASFSFLRLPPLPHSRKDEKGWGQKKETKGQTFSSRLFIRQQQQQQRQSTVEEVGEGGSESRYIPIQRNKTRKSGPPTSPCLLFFLPSVAAARTGEDNHDLSLTHVSPSFSGTQAAAAEQESSLLLVAVVTLL